MLFLRKLLDNLEEKFFKPGKPLERLYPLYEANDTFLYTPGDVTKGSTHVRDAIDTKRMMSMVIVALIPCIFMALYNTGYQAQKIVAAGQALKPAETLFDAVWNGTWRYDVLQALGVVSMVSEGSGYTCTDPGEFFSFGSMLGCLLHGALYFFPVYIVGLAVGGHCELIFALIRKHEINEGFLVTSMLYPLTLPPTIPLWQVAIGIVFGVVVGKEIFGGTGYNFLNPALTARAFLYFAYPKQISGNGVWTAVDGYTGATGLGQLATPTFDKNASGEYVSEYGQQVQGLIADGTKEAEATAQVFESMSTADVLAEIPNGGISWMDAFIGNIHGSMGETCALASLIGAAILIYSRIGSWRIMAGVVIGMTGLSSLLCVIGFSEPVFNIAPWWHLVLGGFAFGTVFMATDPVSSSMTQSGKWVYGALIGFMTVLVRSINPAFPEGIMLAILFGNVFAPLIDYYVCEFNIKRRAERYAS